MADLTDEEAAVLLHDWPKWARPSQMLPGGDWDGWLVLAGRGFGKTRTGAEALREEVESGRAGRIGLVAETSADGRDVMVFGESGIMACSPPWNRPTFTASAGRPKLTWPNGAIATLYDAREPDQLRGPQHDFIWLDELAKFRYAQSVFDQAMFGLRLGDRPRWLATTTPRNIPLLKELLAREGKGVIVTRGTSDDNLTNLAPSYVRNVIDRYRGTRLGRQELNAELLADTPGALWSSRALEECRVEKAPKLVRVVVAVDPPASSGEKANECGIVVAGIDEPGNAYVLDDWSQVASPDEWARKVVAAFRLHNADLIVAEANQGGEMVKTVIQTALATAPIRLVRASRGKYIRAEPCSALYEQGRVKHVGTFPTLEDQMIGFTPARAADRVDGYSPDRVDALVWALTELFPDVVAASIERPERRRAKGLGRLDGLMATNDDILKDAKDIFADCEEREGDNRDAALEDLEFARLGKQWTPEDEEARRAEGRPCLTINRLPAFIRQVVNDARQNSPSIVVRPVDSGADVETADIMSGLIRDIELQSSADIAYDTALDFSASCGFGYWRVNLAYVDDNAFEQDIRIDRVANPFSIYGDPYSDAPDSADWNTAFVLDKMKRSAFERRFKGKDLVPWSDTKWAGVGEAWRSGDDITYAEFWVREQVSKTITLLTNGEIVALDEFKKNLASFQQQGIEPVGQTRQVLSHAVKQYLITACDVLETTPWAGRYIPIIPVYGEDINVNGKRHLRSLIRDAKDPQRMFNYWRTCSTEMVALAPKAPWVGAVGAFKTDPNWAVSHKTTIPTLEYDPVNGASPPQRQPFNGTPVGVINEALAASDDMKSSMGLYNASLGQPSNETSGRAILARQREGDVSTFHFADNQSRAVRHSGRVLIDLIPHVYSTARVIRILGPDKKTTQTVKIGPRDPNAPPPDASQQQQVNRIYDLTVGRYDLAVDAGPSFTTRREEAANQMMELVRAFPQIAPLIGDLLAENLDWPGAQEIAKRLKTLLPPALQNQGPGDDTPPSLPQQPDQPGPQGQPQPGAPAAVPPEAIAQAKQLIDGLRQELAQATNENAQLKQDAFTKKAQVLIDAYEAETDRIKVTGQPAPNPLNPASLNMAGVSAPQPSQQPVADGLAQ